MIKITAKVDTWLKTTSKGSEDPSNARRKKVVSGEDYGVDVLLTTPLVNHQKIRLASGAGDWYIYLPHWDGLDKPSGIPKAAIDLIKEFEGLVLHPYDDGVGVATIGYGTTIYPNGTRVSLSDRSITQSQAEEYLANDVKDYWDTMARTVPYWNEMNDNQRSALLSFSYNLGQYFYGASGFNTISTSLRTKNWDAVPNALMLYTNPGSSVEAGLRRRRVQEGRLWVS
jgi:GH24 family phage-related lysozyme (muramidase)